MGLVKGISCLNWERWFQYKGVTGNDIASRLPEWHNYGTRMRELPGRVFVGQHRVNHCGVVHSWITRGPSNAVLGVCGRRVFGGAHCVDWVHDTGYLHWGMSLQGKSCRFNCCCLCKCCVLPVVCCQRACYSKQL